MPPCDQPTMSTLLAPVSARTLFTSVDSSSADWPISPVAKMPVPARVWPKLNENTQKPLFARSGDSAPKLLNCDANVPSTSTTGNGCAADGVQATLDPAGEALKKPGCVDSSNWVASLASGRLPEAACAGSVPAARAIAAPAATADKPRTLRIRRRIKK